MRKEKMRGGILAATALFLFNGCMLTASADTSRWSSTTYRDEDGDICVDFEDVQVLLPADWSGRCQMAASDESVSFYQTKSRQLYTKDFGYPNGGWLFSICFSSELDFLEHPSYQPLGQVDDGYYYMTFPTDFQAYVDDEEALAEFQEMSSEVDWVQANTTVKNGRTIEIPQTSSSDYILPQSSTEYLSESDLAGMDAAQVQMAINEIYARHHRKFVLPEVQAYFNATSWYTGTIEADDFDVSVMNSYETSNINLMVGYMKKLSSGEQNITIEPSSSTKDLYGMIIESGSGYFRVRQQDGSVIQVWYDSSKLSGMSVTEDDLAVGAVASVIYDAETYEATSILVW